MRKKIIIVLIALLASLVCVCGYGCFGGDRYERDGQGLGYLRSDDYYRVADYEGWGEVIIPTTFNDLPVIEISDGAFENSHLTAVTIPESIISIGYNIFGGCDELEKITVSEDNKNYHSAGNCLIKTDDRVLVSGCSNSVIPDDGSVTAIGDYAFYSIATLESLEIPDCVLQIGNSAFARCISLENITIGNGVKKIDAYVFEDCLSLTSLYLPDGVTEFGERVFDGCSALVIYCKAESKPSEWDYGWNETSYAHFAPRCLAPVVWDCENNEVAADGYIYKFFGGIRYGLKDGVALVVRQPVNITRAIISLKVTYKDEDYVVTSVCDKAFYRCVGLRETQIPDGVIYVGDSAFNGCRDLTVITLPDSVTSIGDSAFAYCSDLQRVTLPNGLKAIGENTFGNCRKLAVVDLPEKLTSIGKNAFASCYKLESIVIPDGVKTIGQLAFYDCTALKSVALPDGLTSIGSEAFNACSSLESIVIPDSVTSIEAFTFYLCRSLTEVNIPDSVTHIGKNAFYACNSLRKIVIPSSVVTMGKMVFERCSNLYIYCEAESKPDGWDDEWDIFDRYSDRTERCIVKWNYKKDN